jgi:hypothetical protein
VKNTYVEDGLVVEELGRNDLLDDLLFDFLAELLSRNILAVLGGDDNSVNTERYNSAAIMTVLDSDLSLGIRTEPGQGAVIARLLHSSVELVRQQQSQG